MIGVMMERMFALTPTDLRELDCRFTYHRPSGDQPQRYEEIRSRARVLARFLLQQTPLSREQETAIARLEECVMWANAAIARRENAEREQDDV